MGWLFNLSKNDKKMRVNAKYGLTGRKNGRFSGLHLYDAQGNPLPQDIHDCLVSCEREYLAGIRRMGGITNALDLARATCKQACGRAQQQPPSGNGGAGSGNGNGNGTEEATKSNLKRNIIFGFIGLIILLILIRLFVK